MATLTYDASQGEPEFNADELDSLAVGERMQQEEQATYAGKFNDAQELEKAYIELQKKLGSNENNSSTGPTGTSEDGDSSSGSADGTTPGGDEDLLQEEVQDANPAVNLINEASNYFAENGSLSEEMIEAFSEMPSADLVSAYIEAQGSIPQVEAPDLSESEVAQIKNQVGGDEQYSNLMGWAAENIPSEIVEAYDSLVDSGNSAAIALALRGISAEYENSNGYEGRMLTGNAATSTPDVFRSQAEVVAAMQDPRYDRDAAYREDVFRKLEQSNVNF